jgi:hypothetical protein
LPFLAFERTSFFESSEKTIFLNAKLSKAKNYLKLFMMNWETNSHFTKDAKTKKFHSSSRNNNRLSGTARRGRPAPLKAEVGLRARAKSSPNVHTFWVSARAFWERKINGGEARRHRGGNTYVMKDRASRRLAAVDVL